jgi:hypothetical protein
MVPLVTGYIEQISQQTTMQLQINQAQSQIDTLKAKVASQSASTAEAGKMKADLEAAKLQYKNVGDNPEVSKIIMDLAWDYDVTITGMIVSQAKINMMGADYPVLVYTLSLSGQVANFQNFLIASGNKLPSSQFTSIIINPAVVEGELDKATISMQVYCNE